MQRPIKSHMEESDRRKIIQTNVSRYRERYAMFAPSILFQISSTIELTNQTVSTNSLTLNEYCSTFSQ
ncbi:MAG: hypothetical protein F6K18_09130 [Okeania sp. SIO2C2]|uniref:hypothetical protein n=1 Tax=Okeania sp. SIO2C2 TaxID=2607787 RepID=UPI0013B69A75|nr:hypothetical protein [Okeania sp. SIO2C2]NEP86984.1 hypothetical protein [Okeania sp. SIO2C2]